MTNYEKYMELIEFRKNTPPPKDVYCEKHHIKPRSIFPELVKDKSNVVLLTAKEHFMAHYYLWKYYKTETNQKDYSNKMAVAFHSMMLSLNKSDISKNDLDELSTLYQEVKNDFRNANSIISKQRFSNPEMRRAASERTRKWASNPVIREQMSQRTKEFHKLHPEIAQNRGKKLRKLYETNTDLREKQRMKAKSVWSDPKRVEEARKRAIDMWKNPDFAENMAKIAAERSQDADRKEAFKQRIKKYFDNPINRERRIERLKNKFSDPIFLAKISKAVVQFDLNGNKVAEYPSARIAAQTLNINPSGIRQNCNGTRKKYKNNYWFYLDKLTDDDINKIKRNHQVKILQYDLNGLFVNQYDNLSEIPIESKYSRSNIKKALENKTKTAYGFMWRYSFDNSTPKTIPTHQRYSNKRPVLQFDNNGNFIMEFDSITSAAAKYSVTPCAIARCCTGKTSSSSNFIWKYKDEFSQNPSHIKQKIEKKTSPLRKRVAQYDLMGNLIAVYDSINNAALSTSIGTGEISAVCRGKRKSTGDFMWRHVFGNTVNETIKPYKLNNDKIKKRVYQYDLNGKLIMSWDSVATAAKELKISPSSITQCCRGRTKTCNGTHWTYHEQESNSV